MLQSFSSDIPFRGLSSNPFTGSPPCVLGKRTVIYGRNGSGKTSLTEALRLADSNGKADAATFKARVVASGAVSTIDLAPGTTPFRLLIYSRYYVGESLHLFLDEGGQALPILKLGAHNVKTESDLEEMRDYLAMLEHREADLEKAVKSIAQGRDTIEKQTKADIISALAPADAAYYNQTRYQVPQVRRLLDDNSAIALATEVLDAEMGAAITPTLDAVSVANQPESVAPTLHSTINTELLGATVESIQLPRLAGNPTLSAWVEAGLGLHQNGDLCGFCQSGTVTAAIIDSYHAHFSKALEALRERLNKAIVYLEERRDDLSAWFTGLPEEGAFLPDYRARARTEREALEAAAATLKTALDGAIVAIKRRLADPLNPLPEAEHLSSAFPIVDATRFLAVVSDNNTASSSQADRVTQAKAAVEAHHGALRGDEYRALGLRLGLADRARSTMMGRSSRVEAKVLALQQSQQDVGRMANLIDADLREHFGHAHLRVSVSDDSKGYVVTRGGHVADHLSEGERNAIAFTYFLRSLEEDGVDPAATVVMIDDPVTSLDKESLFAAFALAEERTTNFAQTIVLTHDYEYFRLQLMEHRSRWGSSQKRIRQNDTAEKQMPEVSLLEIRAISPSGQDSRHGEVREFPRSLIQHPSEYHYLFLHVAEAVQGNSLEYLPLVGNAGRRLLEGFLSFRAPSEIAFQAKVDAVARTATIDTSLKERVVKFLHSQSHREEPRPSAALDFPSIEAELVAALTFIHKADEAHFTDMCIAVEVDPASLIQSLTAHPSV